MCDNSFTQKQSLKRHIKTAHDSAPAETNKRKVEHENEAEKYENSKPNQALVQDKPIQNESSYITSFNHMEKGTNEEIIAPSEPKKIKIEDPTSTTKVEEMPKKVQDNKSSLEKTEKEEDMAQDDDKPIKPEVEPDQKVVVPVRNNEIDQNMLRTSE